MPCGGLQDHLHRFTPPQILHTSDRFPSNQGRFRVCEHFLLSHPIVEIQADIVNSLYSLHGQEMCHDPMTHCTILTYLFLFPPDSYYDSLPLMTHLACMVTHDSLLPVTLHDSFLVSILLVVAVFASYINPHKPSSVFLRLVFIYLLVNTTVLSLHPCVILLPLSFTLIVLNLGRSPRSL